MKFLYSLLAALCISSAGFGQVIALSPTGDGGFETGSTFTSNGWTAANPSTAANQWLIGTAATPLVGTRCVYITNNGSSYTYTLTSTRTAHFFRDFTIPTGSSNINLYFRWKGAGEAGLDYMFISTAATSVVPVANSPASPSSSIAGATLVWTQPPTPAADFTPASVALPVALAGTTVRIIFSWENNNSGGTTPPAALDSIALTYDCAAPSPITGTTIICSGGTSTLADASPIGAWNSSDPTVATVSSAGLVTALAQGTTTISYTTVCLSPATAIVTVNNTPATISGPSIVCIASTITLGETSTGGTWTSSANAIASVDPVSGVVTGAALGTASIIYTNGCGLPASKTVSVTTTPPAITGPTYVCEGGATIALSDGITVGTWSSDVPAYATVASTSGGTATITGLTAGTTTISYFPDTTCATSVVITVNPLPAATIGVVPICVGNSMSLANPAGGGLWYSSVPGVATIDPFTGVVSGIAGGTTVISYTNACGTGTTTVTIDALPEAITGFDSVCVGSHTTLADVTIGGHWESSNIAVASVVSGAGSGLLTGVADGTTTISYIMSGGCYATTEVTAFVLPTAISGLAQICPGGTTTLANSIVGGTWASTNVSVATIVPTSGVVIGVSGDTVGMVYTTPYGCTAYGVVTVNPAPEAILGTSTLCASDKDTLTDLTPGGAWSSLNGSVASIESGTGIVTALNGGIASVKYTLPSGCFTTKTFTINPLPTPVVTFNPAVNTFFATPGFASYQWYNSVGIVTGATTDHTAGVVNGYYYVTVSDTIGCSGSSAHVPYNVSMGVGSAINVSDIQIFPNPSSGIVYIQAPVAVRAVISSADGRKIIAQDDAKKIDISKLPGGLYVVTIYDGQGTMLKVQKLTKE